MVKWVESLLPERKVGGSKSKTEKLASSYMLLQWLTLNYKGLELGWLAQCQFKRSGGNVLFICGMVLQCAGTLKHIYKLLTNNIKPTVSLTLGILP